MKLTKYFALIISISAFLICGVSCNKVSHNGKLDGQWQIMTIEVTASGETSVPKDPSYICFNLHLIQFNRDLGDQNSRWPTGNMTYEKKGGSIYCDFPTVKPENIDAQLGIFGIYSNPVTLEIIKLDGKTLVLRSDRCLITCRRF